MAKELSHVELCEVYRKVFGSGLGQTVLDDLRKSYGDRTSFDPSNPHGTSFKEGQRDVYLTILTMIEERPAKKSKEEVDDA